MAGQHQIWRYDIETRIIKAFSGNGSERNKNGDSAQSTSWAQPSGVYQAPFLANIIVKCLLIRDLSVARHPEQNGCC